MQQMRLWTENSGDGAVSIIVEPVDVGMIGAADGHGVAVVRGCYVRGFDVSTLELQLVMEIMVGIEMVLCRLGFVGSHRGHLPVEGQ